MSVLLVTLATSAYVGGWAWLSRNPKGDRS